MGFEPTVPLNGVRVLSRDVPSATQPSFQEKDMLSLRKELVNKVGAGKPFPVESIPMAGMHGAVGVLHGDAMDRQIDVSHSTDSKILTKGCAGKPFDLTWSILTAEADSVFVGLSDKSFVEFGFRNSAELGVLEVELEVIAGLHDQLFFAAAV